MDMHLVTVYDVDNKFIAYSGPVPEVSQILSEWGSLFCLATDGKVCMSASCVLFSNDDVTLHLTESVLSLCCRFSSINYKKRTHNPSWIFFSRRICTNSL